MHKRKPKLIVFSGLEAMKDARRLGRQVPHSALQFLRGASLSSDGKQIELKWPIKDRRELSKKLEPSMLLSDFVALCGKAPEEQATAIVEFARKHGALSLDQRGRPCSATPVSSEPIEAWLYFSRRVRAILSIISALQEEPPKIGSHDDWRALAGTEKFVPGFVSELRERETMLLDLQRYEEFEEYAAQHHVLETRTPAFKISVDSERRAITIELNLWLTITRVGFMLLMAPRRDWSMYIDYNGSMLAAIALQLSLIAAKADSLFICDGPNCGVPYVRTDKRPKPGESNYCPQCRGMDAEKGAGKGRRASVRRAQQTYRANVAKAKSLNADGLQVKDIAKRMNAEVKQVRAWLNKAAPR